MPRGAARGDVMAAPLQNEIDTMQRDDRRMAMIAAALAAGCGGKPKSAVGAETEVGDAHDRLRPTSAPSPSIRRRC